MGAGALDAVPAPSVGASGGLEGGDELVRKVRNVARVLGAALGTAPIVRTPPAAGGRQEALPPLVAIGASTGGPAALVAVIGSLPAAFPGAVVVVQHVDAQFSADLASWLGGQVALPVHVAGAGDPPAAGRVLLAGGDRDVVLAPDFTLQYRRPRDGSFYHPSDEAIVEAPSWEQPKVVYEALGVKAKILARRPELAWRFDLNELESLMGPKVKLIYICHPSNPTGAILSESELKDICRIASRHGTYVLSDEIYRGLEWEGSLSSSVVNLYERGISTASVSKTLGMSGLRLGWLATQDRQLLEDCMDLKYYISLHQQSRLDEIVAMAALQPEKYWRLVKQTMAAAKVNYDITTEWIRTNGAFKWVPPRGGFLSFPSYDLNVPSWDLCVRLLEKPYKTYILPGSCYGVEGHVRLGFGPGTPAESMKAGLEQINQFVADYKAGKVKL